MFAITQLRLLQYFHVYFTSTAKSVGSKRWKGEWLCCHFVCCPWL